VQPPVDAGSAPEWRRAEGQMRQWAFDRFGARSR